MKRMACSAVSRDMVSPDFRAKQYLQSAWQAIEGMSM
jgi:hypothetical protein